jgi:hypothetical protein
MASAWLKFLKEYYAKNKGTKSYKQAMVDGAKVYKAQKGGQKKKVPEKRRRRRVKRKRPGPTE